MIKFQNVSFSYGATKVLEHLDLTIEAGECVCLFGPSGCGKTTILRLIMGLEHPDDGCLQAPQHPACVFQEDRLVQGLDVLENVCLPLQASQYALAERLLEEVGLGEVKRSSISDLSGGMRRRVALVRAIAYGGDVLLLDEPFNGIDAENKRVLARIIHREFIAKNRPVVLVSHVPEEAELLKAKMITL